MVETNLMFTLAQVTATFVAITAGFYTTKLISIAAEKKRLANIIGEKNHEIEKCQAIIAAHQPEVDRITELFARRQIQSVIDYLVSTAAIHCTKEQFYAAFRKFSGEPNDFVKKIIDSDFNSIRESIDERIAKSKYNTMATHISDAAVNYANRERDALDTALSTINERKN